MYSSPHLKKLLEKFPPGQIPEDLNKYTLLLLNIPLKINAKTLFFIIKKKGQITRLFIKKQSPKSKKTSGYGIMKLHDKSFYETLLASKELSIIYRGAAYNLEVSEYYNSLEREILFSNKSRRTIRIDKFSPNLEIFQLENFLPQNMPCEFKFHGSHAQFIFSKVK